MTKPADITQTKQQLTQALMSPDPAKALNHLLNINGLQQSLPELLTLHGSQQNSLYHAEGDVWQHTMLVINLAAKLKMFSKQPEAFMFAALLHDIGKPATLKRVNGQLSNHRHENVGAKMIRPMLTRLQISDSTINYVKTMVRHHMNVHCLLSMRPFKVKNLMYATNMHDLFLLYLADEHGIIDNSGEQNHDLEIATLINNYSNGSFGEIKPLITNRDLLTLGVHSAKTIDQYLADARALQFQGKTRNELLSIMQKRIIPPFIRGATLKNYANIPHQAYQRTLKMMYQRQLQGASKQTLLQELPKLKFS